MVFLHVKIIIWLFSVAEILIKHWCLYKYKDILLYVVFIHLSNFIVNLMVKLTYSKLEFLKFRFARQIYK